MIPHLRGWIGVGTLIVGVIMTCFEQTRPASWFLIGIGAGMMASGF